METTLSRLTDAQIQALRAESARAGDTDMVRICDIALVTARDVTRARAECQRVIENAIAQVTE